MRRRVASKAIVVSHQDRYQANRGADRLGNRNPKYPFNMRARSGDRGFLAADSVLQRIAIPRRGVAIKRHNERIASPDRFVTLQASGLVGRGLGHPRWALEHSDWRVPG